MNPGKSAASTAVLPSRSHNSWAIINEAGDVFAEDYPMPPVEEGDIVAILNAGAYHQAMSSTHCLRPQGEAIFLDR